MSRLKNDSTQIIILADHKIGTTNQSEALAQSLELDYRIIEVSYSYLAKLPNFILINPFLRLSKRSRNLIKSLSIADAKYLISAGRRLAPIALAVKKYHKLKSLKLIQIMNPQISFDYFDLVILPRHDQLSDLIDNNNVVESIGALTKENDCINPKILSAFNHLFLEDKANIALLFGGKSKSGKITADCAKKLAYHLSMVVNNMKANLLVVTSRRSQDNVVEALDKNLSCTHRVLLWSKIKNNNPYPAILKKADYFIVTGDSISMISECCQTGKPVYIFDKNSISSKKHRQFHQDLYLQGYAKNFDSNIESLIDYSPKKLDEAKKIAAIIKSRLN